MRDKLAWGLLPEGFCFLSSSIDVNHRQVQLNWQHLRRGYDDEGNLKSPHWVRHFARNRPFSGLILPLVFWPVKPLHLHFGIVGKSPLIHCHRDTLALKVRAPIAKL